MLLRSPHLLPLDFSLLLRDTLICKENKHHQKEGKYEESVSTPVGRVRTHSFPRARMDRSGEDSVSESMSWSGLQNLFMGTAVMDDAGKRHRPKEQNGSVFKRQGSFGQSWK